MLNPKRFFYYGQIKGIKNSPQKTNPRKGFIGTQISTQIICLTNSWFPQHSIWTFFFFFGGGVRWKYRKLTNFQCPSGLPQLYTTSAFSRCAQLEARRVLSFSFGKSFLFKTNRIAPGLLRKRVVCSSFRQKSNALWRTSKRHCHSLRDFPYPVIIVQVKLPLTSNVCAAAVDHQWYKASSAIPSESSWRSIFEASHSRKLQMDANGR